MPETAMAVARTTPCEQREEDMVDESRWELEQSMLCDLLNMREYALVGKRGGRWCFYPLHGGTCINKYMAA